MEHLLEEEYLDLLSSCFVFENEKLNHMKNEKRRNSLLSYHPINIYDVAFSQINDSCIHSFDSHE